MRKLLFESAVLISSFVIVFLWQKTEASAFTVPFLGLLITVYLIVSARKKGKGFLTLGGGNLGIFILTTLILLLIFSTESINSPLFFLLYFLGFGIAFVFEPVTTFVFVIGAVLLFFPDAAKADATNNLLKLGSLLLISPLAYFFGKEYQKGEQQDEKIEEMKERTEEAAGIISEDIEEVLEDEKENLKQKDMEKLNEVLEETEDLRAESADKV
ncbi:MAG: hypothetical protein AAB702_02400 [Patescibacteria group bacterium]